jgi:hypothetical protein
MKIVLFLENIPTDSGFHYSTKQGQSLYFGFDRERNRHACKIDMEQWRANDFFLAKDLLDQMLPIPILFDIEEDAKEEAPSLVKEVQKRKAHPPRGLILTNALKALEPDTLEAIGAPA